jgi:glutamate-1-semialdehyde 2,1-aminomutase
VRDGWRIAAERTGLPITVGGLVPMSAFAIQHKESPAAHTLFTQLMLDRGFLASKSFYTTFAHQDEVIEEYLQAAEDAFGVIAHALEQGTVREKLKGPVAHGGFARLN